MTEHSLSSQKFISFSDAAESDIKKIENYMKQGWAIVKLMPPVSGSSNYIGIMEKVRPDNNEQQTDEQVVFIPPRKKIFN